MSHQVKNRPGAQSGVQSGAQSKKMLLAISDTPLSSHEIAQMIDLESKSGAFKRTLKSLIIEEFIEYTIPDKPNSRLQKYCLTEKGRKVLTTEHTEDTEKWSHG